MAQVFRYTSDAHTVTICTVTIRISFHVLLSRLVDLLTHLRSKSNYIYAIISVPTFAEPLTGETVWSRTILSLNAQCTFLQQQIAVLLASKSPSIVFVDCSKLPFSRYLTLLFVFIQFSVCLVTITTFILAAVLYRPISDNGLKFINFKCTIYDRNSKQSYIFTGTRSLVFQ